MINNFYYFSFSTCLRLLFGFWRLLQYRVLQNDAGSPRYTLRIWTKRNNKPKIYDPRSVEGVL